MSIYDYTPLLIYSCIVMFALGTCLGSFINCAAWRVVHGESFIRGRSHCAVCGHELRLADLIPVVSWAALKGRCRYCGEKISPRYLITETLFGLLSVVCLLRFDLTVLCARNYVFICVLFMLTLTDIEDMTIPDGCHVTALIAWVVTAPMLYGSVREAAGYVAAGVGAGAFLLIVSLILDRILGTDTLGGGDVKLVAVAGLYLGAAGVMFMIIISCIAALIYNAVWMKKPGRTMFPFGPWLAAAAAFMLMFGGGLTSWYVGLIM